MKPKDTQTPSALPKCPFCGHTDIGEANDPRYPSYCVICNACGAIFDPAIVRETS